MEWSDMAGLARKRNERHLCLGLCVGIIFINIMLSQQHVDFPGISSPPQLGNPIFKNTIHPSEHAKNSINIDFTNQVNFHFSLKIICFPRLHLTEAVSSLGEECGYADGMFHYD